MNRRHRARLWAGILAAGLVLTGCGGGENHDRTSSREGGGNHAPDAPGFEAPRPDAGREGAPEGEQRSPRPSADYLSTFALDVDTASYGYARRTLAEGRLPAPASVRPEEFVNSFRPDYPRPEGDGFSVTVDGARTDDEGWSLVRVGLATAAAEREGERPPAALTFVVDISGSMAETGRLDLVKESLGILTDELRDDDSVALVTFSDEAETRLPMTRVKGQRERIHGIVDELATTSSTNVEAGAHRVRRRRRGAPQGRHQPGRPALRRPRQHR